VPRFQLHVNRLRAVGPSPDRPEFSAAAAAQVRRYHTGLPDYCPTPLRALEGLARELRLGAVHLKDESGRFGLGAFKALGAGYAMWRVAQEHRSDALTFVTATDGNHGRAVAWAAQRQGHRAVVYVPAAASDARMQAIASLGAEVQRLDGSYDDACDRAAADAESEGWFLLQDTARPGYERVPRWVMQGYLTLIDETIEQLGGQALTHVLLQCGVGSFAAAMSANLRARLPRPPRIILVEPENAACALAAFEAEAPAPPRLAGDCHTFMACLSCGQLSTLAWDILRADTDFLVTVADDAARLGMRSLAAPPTPDPAVVSGESGAATTGALICTSRAAATRTALGLNADARVLLISTEGATDPEVYRETVAVS
jgi:diaminopropionate ammonia-lyase